MLVLLLIIAAFGFVFLGGFAGAATAIVGAVLIGLVLVVVGVVVQLVSRAVDDWKQYGWRGRYARYVPAAPAPPSRGAYAIGVIYLSAIPGLLLTLAVGWVTGWPAFNEKPSPGWEMACMGVGYAVSVALAVRLYRWHKARYISKNLSRRSEGGIAVHETGAAR